MESQDENAALLKLAEAVSDGHPVDWDSAQSLLDDAERELAPLRALEAVAAAYRAARRHRGSSPGTPVARPESAPRLEFLPEAGSAPVPPAARIATRRPGMARIRGW